MLECGENRMAESNRINNKVALGKDIEFQSLSPKHFNSEFELMA